MNKIPHRRCAVQALRCRWFQRALFVIIACVLVACDTSQVPTGAVLAIDPSAQRFDVLVTVDGKGRCVFEPQNHQDIPIVVSLYDAQGAPVNRAELVIHTDYSDQSHDGSAVLALYDDRNSNGVIDGPAELVSGVDGGAFVTRTGRWTGDRHLLLRVNLSCPFAGELRVFAGALSARARVQVDARQTLVLDRPVPTLRGNGP